MNQTNSHQNIITDVNEFWINSINPVNTDSIFAKQNLKSVKEVIKLLSRQENFHILNLFNNLSKNYFLLKGEYLVDAAGTSFITNKRVYLFATKEISIPINIITFFDYENGKLVFKYLGEYGEKKYYPEKNVLNPASMNNHIEVFKNSPDLNNLEIQKIISTPKINLSELGLQDISVEIKEYRKPKNYDTLIGVCVLLLFMGGCIYYVDHKFGNNNTETITNTNPAYNSETGKKKIKCPWCGGIGRVGYLGESKAQVEKTGMGLGNECTTCQGTGYVDDSNK